MQLNASDREFIFFDGAMGTMLQKAGLKPGERPDIMNMTAPQIVEQVHRNYVQAGSDIICTNTFGSNAVALRGTGYTPREVISAAVGIAKKAADDTASVALDIGPIGELIEPLGSISMDSAYEMFKEQVIAGDEAGADIIAIETMSDLSEMKAALLAAVENSALPVFATMTFGKNGRTFTGCPPESFALMAESLGAAAIGINCSLQPAEMYSTARSIAEYTCLPLIIKPNAGLPDSASGGYSISPTEFAEQMTEFAKIGVKIVGGCCGTTPEYITALKNAVAPLKSQRGTRVGGRYICSAFHVVSTGGLVPTERFKAERMPESAVLDDIARQDDAGLRVVEVLLPDRIGAAEAAKLVTAAQELTNRPLLIQSGDYVSLGGALRAVSGVAAVALRGAGSSELKETAGKYGAVIL